MESQNEFRPLKNPVYKSDPDYLIGELAILLMNNQNYLDTLYTQNKQEFKVLQEAISQEFFEEYTDVYFNLLDKGNTVDLARFIYMAKSSIAREKLTGSSLLIFDETKNLIEQFQNKVDGILKNDGCYIATMIYGDYDHPQVLELRKFRDDFLSKTILGRSFIRLYYKYSPSLAQRLKNKQSINLIIRKGLDQFIKTIKK